MKWLLIVFFVLSCQKQEQTVTQATENLNTEAAKTEDCDEKAKEAQKVEITEETIKLGGQPDAGCTLE